VAEGLHFERQFLPLDLLGDGGAELFVETLEVVVFLVRTLLHSTSVA
jgi:hypothetical protein